MPSASFIQTPLEPALLASFWAFSERNDLAPSASLRLVAHHVVTRAGFQIDDYDPGTERRGDYQNWARRRHKAIDESGIRPVLIARVSPGFKDALARYASSLEQSPPVALKAIVKQVVASAKISAEDYVIPKRPELRSNRYAVRFSTEELRKLEPLAADFGGVRQWLVALARSRIAPGVPHFTPAALQSLYESNRELGAIGRNVNQIAHAVNLDLKQAGHLRGSADLLARLEGLKRSIDAHTERVMALCEESTTRWSTA